MDNLRENKLFRKLRGSFIKEGKTPDKIQAYKYAEKQLSKIDGIRDLQIHKVERSKEYPGALEVFFSYRTSKTEDRGPYFNSMIVWYENNKLYGEW